MNVVAGDAPPAPPVLPTPSQNVAVVNSVQALGAIKVNTPSTLIFMGQNLTSEVKVTLGNCDTPQTQLISAAQIRHQCTPRVAGAQAAGWKANGSEANVRPLGTVNVVAGDAPPAPSVLPTPTPTPTVASIQSVSPTSAAVSAKVKFVVIGSQLSSTLKLNLTGEQCFNIGGDNNRREFECSNNSVTSPKQLTVMNQQSASIFTQTFTVINPVAPTQPIPPTAVKITNLTAGSNITVGVPWTLRLTTSVRIYSADVIFTNYPSSPPKRIPLEGDATNWASRDINSKFADAGTFNYKISIRRESNSQLEDFPGGTVEVRPAPIITNAPRITSALTSEQGRPYNLTVQTSASADKVTVQWPDASSEQSLNVKDGQRTQWEFGNRAFLKYDPVNIIIKVYKDGVVQPVGQTTGVLTFTQQAANIKLLEIASNIVVGENRYVTVEASLSVAKVTFQLGSEPPFSLAGIGQQSSSQLFKSQVPFKTPGPAVPFTIIGFNAQGQVVGNKVTGTAVVKAASDALKTPNPIPVEINKGQSVSWQFLTNDNPAEMWLQFSAPINRLALIGNSIVHTFSYPAGSYTYSLMRKDHLGNIFPISGASGALKINEVQVNTQFISHSANGQNIREGAVITVKKGELITYSVRTNQPVQRLLILIPSRSWDKELGTIGGDRTNWTTGMAGLLPGIYAAKLYAKDINDQVNNALSPVNFTIVVQP